MTAPTPSHPSLAPPLHLKPLPSSRQPTNFTALLTLIDDECQPAKFHQEMPKTWFLPILETLPSHMVTKGKNWVENDAPESKNERDIELRVLTDHHWVSRDLHNKGLAVLFLMCRRFTLDVNPNNMPITLIDTALLLVNGIATNDLWLVPGKVWEFAQGIVSLCSAAHRDTDAVDILDVLLSRFCPPGELSPLHRIFFETSLRAKKYAAAVLLLDTRIEKIGAVNYLDVLSYYYLGGLILLAGLRWEDAREFFEIVVTAPGNAASAIQVAAHKKLVLVNLIISGKNVKYPKYESSAVKAAIKSHAAIYNELGSVFEHMEEGKMQEIAAKGKDTFAQDGNAALVGRLWDTVAQRKLLMLRDTYSKLSVADVAKKISPQWTTMDIPATVQLVSAMIEDGKLQAKLTDSTTPGQCQVITFHVDVPSVSTGASLEQLQRMTEEAQTLWRALGEHDSALGLKEKYLKHAGKFGNDDPVVNTDIAMGLGGSTGVKGAGSNWDDTGF